MTETPAQFTRRSITEADHRDTLLDVHAMSVASCCGPPGQSAAADLVQQHGLGTVVVLGENRTATGVESRDHVNGPAGRFREGARGCAPWVGRHPQGAVCELDVHHCLLIIRPLLGFAQRDVVVHEVSYEGDPLTCLAGRSALTPTGL
nr:hypothetical protein [Actinacidiphila oryziradicis]